MDQIEEIKSKIDIVDVIGDYIKLQKAGANHRAPCPFHAEEKPSMFISPVKQIWKCFGCGIGGSVFDFVMNIEGVEFGEALEILANKAGVELRKVAPEQLSKKKRLYEICELATKFYEKQLESNVGKKAKQYLLDRTITEDSIGRWRLGYSPDKWGTLTQFLISRGYNKREILKVGLGILNDKGDFYDRFRGRIMFPIFDLHGRVIGFGGRIFKDKEKTAKYVNTPNTPLYNKSYILYGLNEARVDARRESACIVSEGYTDVILSNQSGVKNIVASSGTALTHQQLSLLKRYTDNLFFAFDMDTAGSGATKRGIGLAQERGFNVKIVLMPASHDPADLIKDGVEEWKKAIEEARDVISFYLESALDRFDKETPDGKKAIGDEVLPVIKAIPNEISRFHWIQKMAEILETSEEVIEREMEKIEVEEKKEVVDTTKKADLRETTLEDGLLVLLLQDPKGVDSIKDKELLSPDLLEIISALRKNEYDLEKAKESLSDDLKRKVEEGELEIEVFGGVEDPSGELNQCIMKIKRLKTKQKMEAVARRLREAEKAKDQSQIEMLTKEFDNYSKELSDE